MIGHTFLRPDIKLSVNQVCGYIQGDRSPAKQNNYFIYSINLLILHLLIYRGPQIGRISLTLYFQAEINWIHRTAILLQGRSTCSYKWLDLYSEYIVRWGKKKHWG